MYIYLAETRDKGGRHPTAYKNAPKLPQCIELRTQQHVLGEAILAHFYSKELISMCKTTCHNGIQCIFSSKNKLCPSRYCFFCAQYLPLKLPSYHNCDTFVQQQQHSSVKHGKRIARAKLQIFAPNQISSKLAVDSVYTAVHSFVYDTNRFNFIFAFIHHKLCRYVPYVCLFLQYGARCFTETSLGAIITMKCLFCT